MWEIIIKSYSNWNWKRYEKITWVTLHAAHVVHTAAGPPAGCAASPDQRQICLNWSRECHPSRQQSLDTTTVGLQHWVPQTITMPPWSIYSIYLLHQSLWYCSFEMQMWCTTSRWDGYSRPDDFDEESPLVALETAWVLGGGCCANSKFPSNIIALSSAKKTTPHRLHQWSVQRSWRSIYRAANICEPCRSMCAKPMH